MRKVVGAPTTIEARGTHQWRAKCDLRRLNVEFKTVKVVNHGFKGNVMGIGQWAMRDGSSMDISCDV